MFWHGPCSRCRSQNASAGLLTAALLTRPFCPWRASRRIASRRRRERAELEHGSSSDHDSSPGGSGAANDEGTPRGEPSGRTVNMLDECRSVDEYEKLNKISGPWGLGAAVHRPDRHPRARVGGRQSAAVPGCGLCTAHGRVPAAVNRAAVRPSTGARGCCACVKRARHPAGDLRAWTLGVGAVRRGRAEHSAAHASSDARPCGQRHAAWA